MNDCGMGALHPWPVASAVVSLSTLDTLGQHALDIGLGKHLWFMVQSISLPNTSVDEKSQPSSSSICKNIAWIAVFIGVKILLLTTRTCNATATHQNLMTLPWMKPEHRYYYKQFCVATASATNIRAQFEFQLRAICETETATKHHMIIRDTRFLSRSTIFFHNNIRQ